MKSSALLIALAPLLVASPATAQPSNAIGLWNQGKVAFGIFVPNGAAARPAVYANPLYDFLFLNLESRYDAAAVKAVVEGIRASTSLPRKTLVVRIPSIARDGADAAKARIAEVFALGGDGVTLPHVQNVEEARQALGFFRDSGASIWSASNRNGDKLAMLMVEDPGALAHAREIAGLNGYSILACGIGSLTQALGGNREAAEAGNQRVLAETKRARVVNMLTTTTRDVELRVQQGYLALIAQGSNADDAIKTGRAAAGR